MKQVEFASGCIPLCPITGSSMKLQLLQLGLLVLLMHARVFSCLSATNSRDDLTDEITALPGNGDRRIPPPDRHSLSWRRRSGLSHSSTARQGALLLSLGDIEHRLGSKMLPEGTEVAAHVVVGNTTRLYFIVKKDNSPLNMVITPCLSEVTWSLYYDPVNAIIRHRHFADQSVAANYSFDGQQPLANQTGYDVMYHKQLAVRHGVYRLEFQASDSPGQIRAFISTSLSTLPETHYPLLPVDKRVKVAAVGQHEFVASWRRSRPNYFEDETTSSGNGPDKFTYCVVVNRKSNLRSVCAVELAAMGGTGPPSTFNRLTSWQPIRSNAWNFRSWVSAPSGSNHRGRYRSGSDGNGSDWKLDDFKCSLNQTHYRYRSAVSSTQYYVNVLVIDSLTGAASVYQPASVLTRPETKTYRLRDSTIQTFSVSRTSPVRTIEYRAPPQWKQQTNGSLTVVAQLCESVSAVRLDIMAVENESSNSTSAAVPTTSLSVQPGNVPSLLTIEMSPNSSGIYTIVLTLLDDRRRQTRSLKRFGQHVPNDDDHPTTVRIYASGLHGPESPGFPFPLFPADRTVQVFDTLVGCRSATVAWILAPSLERQLYCVRVTPAAGMEQPHPSSSTRANGSAGRPSRCAAVGSDLRRRRHIVGGSGGGGVGGQIEGWTVSGSQTSARRVSCRSLRIEDPRRTAVTETLTGLEPNETYSVDVFVVKSGRKGQAIGYDRTMFRTKSHC